MTTGRRLRRSGLPSLRRELFPDDEIGAPIVEHAAEKKQDAADEILQSQKTVKDCWAASLTYLQGRVDGLIGIPGQDRHEIVMGSGRYDLAPGLDVVTAIGWQRYESELTGLRIEDGAGQRSRLDVDNAGAFATVGLQISF